MTRHRWSAPEPRPARCVHCGLYRRTIRRKARNDDRMIRIVELSEHGEYWDPARWFSGRC